MTNTASRGLRFLSAQHIKRLHCRLINPFIKPTQPNLLLSAVDSPINHNYYAHESDPFVLAANVSDKLMKNHAFPDGNKRTGLLAADMFLKLNGYQIRPEHSTTRLEDAQVAACTNALTIAQMAAYYKMISIEIGLEAPAMSS